MEKRYQIELTETQLRLIADCVEDCHRFMGGQMDMGNTTSRLESCCELREELYRLKHYVTPDLPYGASYGWNGGSCPNDFQRKFIAQTYPIYREIRHFFVTQFPNSGGDWNVYKSDTLTCAEGGEPIKIKEIPTPTNVLIE